MEWISLHADALASVLRYLHRQKDILAATGVCSHWRAVGTALFFSGSTWQGEAAILHPAQLLTLVRASFLASRARLKLVAF